MPEKTIFVKTDLGHTEVQTRSGQLTPRQRRILIFIDGKNTVSDLRALGKADDLTHTLGLLEEEGYIEMVTTSHSADHSGAQSITAFRPLPSKSDIKNLEKSRNYMLNTLKTFCGSYAHVNLQSNIFHAENHQQLRDQFDLWFHAIVQSREGRRRSEELRADLLKVI